MTTRTLNKDEVMALSVALAFVAHDRLELRDGGTLAHGITEEIRSRIPLGLPSIGRAYFRSISYEGLLPVIRLEVHTGAHAEDPLASASDSIFEDVYATHSEPGSRCIEWHSVSGYIDQTVCTHPLVIDALGRILKDAREGGANHAYRVWAPIPIFFTEHPDRPRMDSEPLED